MTTEQQAHDDFETAIEDFLQATGHGGLLQDWVLVTHSLMAVDGQEKHETIWSGTFPRVLYRSLGLVGEAMTKIKADIKARARGE